MSIFWAKKAVRNNLFAIVISIIAFLGGSIYAYGFNKGSNEAVKAWAQVNRHSVTIGDKIRYTIVVKFPRDVEIKFPRFVGNLGGFAVRDFGVSKRNWLFFKVYKKWYILDTYTSGDYTIPAAVVKYRKKGAKGWREISVKKVKIKVKSVLKSDLRHSALRGIYPPLYYPSKKAVLIAVVLAVLLVLSALAWWLIVRKKKVKESIPKLKAHEIAYNELEKLSGKDYISKGEFELYFTELSDIVRHYLENRFNIRAPEMTTEEFLNTIGRNKVFPYEHKSFLRDFLSHCDLVKFARYESNRIEAQKGYDAAKNLIDETKEDLQD